MRKRLSVLVAVLLVLYAFADVTVLQAYCGNETVGIPPASKIAAVERSAARHKAAQTTAGASMSKQQPQPGDDQNSDAPGGDDECFCCCPHVVTASFNFVPLSAATVVYHQSYSSFPKFLHSDSHLGSCFRPPRAI